MILYFRITSGNPRLFNCRDESVRQEKRMSVRFFYLVLLYYMYERKINSFTHLRI